MDDREPLSKYFPNLVPDDAFARAYDAVSDRFRALLKTAIARLYVWHAPSPAESDLEVRLWRQGFVSHRRVVPADYAILLMDRESRSPSQMLAGLIPALNAGISNVLPVWTCPAGDIHPPMLTALELAGQEFAARQDENEAFPGNMPGRGVLLDLRAGEGGAVSSSPGLGVWSPPRIRRAGVLQDKNSPFDLEALAFSHPDLEFEVFGSPGPFPETGRFRPCSGSPGDFAEQAFDVAYCLDGQGANPGCPLVLGAGHESAWVWPDLGPDLFHRATVFWSDDERRELV